MKKTIRNSIKGIAAISLAAAMCLGLAACGGSAQETTAPETTEAVETTVAETTTAQQAEETTAAESKTMGQKTTGAESFLLTNKTGKDIVGFALTDGEVDMTPVDDSLIAADEVAAAAQKADANEDNLLDKTDVFEKNETRMVFFDFVTEEVVEENAAEGVEEGVEEPTEDAKLLTTPYSAKVTLDDGTIFVLHSFPTDITKGEICMEGEIGYLVYKHEDSSESISTLMAEKTIAENGGVVTEAAGTDAQEAVGAEAVPEEVYEQPAEVPEEGYVEDPGYTPDDGQEVYDGGDQGGDEGGYDGGDQGGDQGGDEGGYDGGDDGGDQGGDQGGYDGGDQGGDQGGDGGGDDDGCIDDGLFY